MDRKLGTGKRGQGSEHDDNNESGHNTSRANSVLGTVTYMVPARAAMTNTTDQVASTTAIVFSHSSGGCKVKIKVPVGLVPPSMASRQPPASCAHP